MTPLARAILTDRLQRAAKRQFVDKAEVACKLEGDWLCFETSQIVDPCQKLAAELWETGIKPPHLKLPAPKTWIEFIDPRNGNRAAYFLAEGADGSILMSVACKAPDFFSSALLGALSPTDLHTVIVPKNLPADAEQTWFFALAMVYMINSPQWFAHNHHPEHAGLARKLRTARELPGKFPYLGWTEIVLEVPGGVGAPCDHGLPSGRQMSRHSVRGHWRTFKDGRPPIWQPYHWRGNPALGLKQSRYLVVPPQSGALP